MVSPRPGGKNKKKDEGKEDAEEYSKVYDEMVKLVQKEGQRVKV